eukprot:1774922-Prymnesium_polylepis.1
MHRTFPLSSPRPPPKRRTRSCRALQTAAHHDHIDGLCGRVVPLPNVTVLLRNELRRDGGSGGSGVCGASSHCAALSTPYRGGKPSLEAHRCGSNGLPDGVSVASGMCSEMRADCEPLAHPPLAPWIARADCEPISRKLALIRAGGCSGSSWCP